jgi:hypothetical protein
MANMDLNVGVNLQVVPDGLRFEGGIPKVCLSLSITPSIDDRPTAWKVDIRSWPSEIRKKLAAARGFSVAVGKVSAAASDFTVTDPRWIGGLYLPRDKDVAHEAAADRLWQRIFAPDCDLDKGFEALLIALKEGLESDRASPTADAHTQLVTYDACGLAAVLDAFHLNATLTSVLMNTSDAMDSSVRDGIRNPLDSGDPNLQFWKRFSSDWLGVKNADDAVGRLGAAAARRPFCHQIGCDGDRDDVLREMREDAEALAGRAPADRAAMSVPGELEGLARTLRDNLGNDSIFRPAPTADRTRDSTVVPPEQVRALRRQLIRFSETWGLGWKPVDRPADAEKDEEEKEAPRRKYGAIQSYPTLAKFLSLIVDIEVPLADLLAAGAAGEGGRTYGAVAVALGSPLAPAIPPDSVTLIWTACVHRPKTVAMSDYFGPCLKHEAANLAPDPQAELKEGVLDLSGEMAPGVPRFRLNTFDVTGQMFGLMTVAEDSQKRDHAGLEPGRINTALSEPRSRGIELFDLSIKQREISKAQQDRIRDSVNDDPGAVRLEDIESLMAGFRIDVALCGTDGNWKRPDRWRTLMAKDLHFRVKSPSGNYQYRDIPEDYLRGINRLEIQARDEGHSRMMTGEITVQAEVPDDPIDIPPPQPPVPPEIVPRIKPHPQVFAWGGQSLAVAAALEEAPRAADATDSRVATPDPALDLAVDLELDLPGEPDSGQIDRRPAPLRDGRSYMFGARVALQNGCGLRFEDARARYVDPGEKIVLGETPTTPFTYLRRERVHAPDVLLAWNNVMVRRPPAEWPGESIDVMVVRTGKTMNTRASERLLVPPRATFDIAEQAGVLDAPLTENSPMGAFSHDRFAAWLDPETGTFPVARKGKWEFPELQDPTKLPEPVEQRATETSRGSVLVLTPGKPRPKAEFHPDPLARMAIAKFCHVEDGQAYSAPGFGAPSRAVEFWSAGKSPRDAGPILLSLRRARSGEQPKLKGWVDNSDTRARLERYRDSILVSVNRLSIALQPAEVVDLEIWSAADGRKLLTTHHASNRLNAVLARVRADVAARVDSSPDGVAPANLLAVADTLSAFTGASAASAMDAAQARYRVNGIQSVKRVRLVHAVEKPIDAPAFVNARPEDDPSAGAMLQFYPVTLVASADGSAPGGRPSWADYTESNAHLPQHAWQSSPGGTTTFFVGKLMAHRKSTGKLRCEARWREYGAECEIFDARSKTWSERPPFQYARLFQIDNLAAELEPKDEVDLLHEDGNGKAVRALSHAFTNGKARLVSLMLTATSRFTSFFSLDEVSGGRFERSSADFGKGDAETWIKATIRPAPPVIDRVIPVFQWTTGVTRNRKHYTFERNSLVRVYLKRPWYSSGQGEKLALIGWPHDLAAGGTPDETICDLDDTGRLRGFITRWGADPIRLSGKLPELISADDLGNPTKSTLGNFEDKVSDLLLTLAPDPSDVNGGGDQSPASARVSIFTYKPTLDPQEGLWTADIAIKHGNSYFPFVQLGLARYQPKAIKDFELSTPAAHIVQIPPLRRGEVTFESDRRLRLDVRGVGYRRSKIHPAAAQDDPTNWPLLNVKLLRAADEDDIPTDVSTKVNWRPVIDKDGLPVQQLQVRPSVTGDEVSWKVSIELPESRRTVHYALYVEEVELMQADKFVQNGAQIEFDLKLKERGPMFAHVVDLRR